MKSKVNERKSMGRIQLGDVYNDDGQHFKVITFRDPDEPHPVGVLLDTGVIMFYNEQTFGDFQLIERDGQEVIEESNLVIDDVNDILELVYEEEGIRICRFYNRQEALMLLEYPPDETLRPYSP